MPIPKLQITFDFQLQTRNIQIELGLWKISQFQILKTDYNFTSICQKISDSIRNAHSLESIKDDSVITRYRDFYWHKLHVDPTKIRPSAEALIRRILSQKEIPKINPLVDAYNWASIASHIPMGAYDLSTVMLPLQLRFTKFQEVFNPIGKPAAVLDSDTLILSDSDAIILCQYPYRDSQRTMVGVHSQEILVIAYGVPGIMHDQLQKALDYTQEYLNWMQSHQIVQYLAEEYSFFSN